MATTTAAPTRHPALVLTATLAAASLVMASTTAVTATLPLIGGDLGATQTEVQWIADAYPVVLAALLLPAGALLDRFGRRRGLLTGLVLMVLTVLWAGVADSAGELILARGLSGVAGALIFPATLATITGVFDDGKRAFAVGLWASSVMAGGGYGMVLGGATAEWADWDVAFFAVAGISAVCLVLCLAGVPETRDPEHAALDPVGGLVSILAIGGIVVGVIEWPSKGVEDPWVWGSLLAGFIGLAAFVAWELRTPRPLLDVRLFALPMFGVASLWLFVMYAVAYGLVFLVFQYYAFVLEWGPFISCLSIMPFVVPVVLTTPLGAPVSRLIGVKATLLVAMGIYTGGALLTALVGDARSATWLFTGLVALGLGAVGQGIATQAIIDALPRAKQGVASAVNDLSREVGAAIGIAVLGSAFTAGYHHHLDSQAEPVAEIVRSAPATGLAVAPEMPDPVGTVDLVQQGVVTGWEWGMYAAAAALALTFVVIAVRAPGRRTGTHT